jgi:hypothetical protein
MHTHTLDGVRNSDLVMKISFYSRTGPNCEIVGSGAGGRKTERLTAPRRALVLEMLAARVQNTAHAVNLTRSAQSLWIN